MIGTYKITNIDTGKYYYGSSKNVESRLKRHKRELKKIHIIVFIYKGHIINMEMINSNMN
jgi:predicted GIY-YIG superfamily endonuclease